MAKKDFEIEDNRISMDQTISEMVNPFEDEKEELKESHNHKKAKVKKGKSIMVAMRIEPDKWDSLKAIARIDATSLSAVLDRLIDKEIKSRKEDIEQLSKIRQR